MNYTDIRKTNRSNLKDIIPLEKPFSITIDPCSLCNFKCKQCLQSDNQLSNKMDLKMMKLDEFKHIIDNIKIWGKIKSLKLYNCGEPLLNPGFMAMLKYAKEMDVADRIELTSNCALLTKEISEKSVEYGLDYLRVSIYSVIQENHEDITNSKINISEIYDNLKYLKEIKQKYNSQKPFIAIKMFDCGIKEENEIFLEKYSEISDEIFFEKLHNFSGEHENNYINEYYEENNVLYKSKIAKKSCPWPFFSFTVQSNGDVICCCVDWFGNTKVGNVFENSLQDIWNGKNMYDFRVMQLKNRRCENESCKNCDVYLTDEFTIDDIDGLSADVLDNK